MSEKQSKTLAKLRLGLLVVLLIAFGFGLVSLGTDGMGDLLERAEESRWGIVGFIAIYILLVIALAPGTAATITSALIFGFGTGLFVSVVGASVGATAAFVISRALGREGAVALLGDRLASIDKWLGKREFASLLVLRLLPVVPFNGLNYAAGLSSVKLRNYIAATVLGILPGTTLTTFTVSRAGEPGGTGFILGVIFTVVAIIVSTILAKRATSRRAVDPSPES